MFGFGNPESGNQEIAETEMHQQEIREGIQRSLDRLSSEEYSKDSVLMDKMVQELESQRNNLVALSEAVE